MINNIEIYIINGIGYENTDECLNSLKETCKDFNKIYIKILNEKINRESTINWIIKERDKGKDCLIFANDIRFMNGWWEALKRNIVNGDILGFTMLDYNTNLIQDNGYEFIKIDEKITYKGNYKNKNIADIKLEKFRECESICGCAMFIKKEVFEDIETLPKESMNRWGELILCHKARERGFKIIVLSSTLLHKAISTKLTNKYSLSSPSWLIEQSLWNIVIEKHLLNIDIRRNITRHLSDELKEKIENKNKILIYGCGTISHFICSKLSLNIDFEILSGLKEEIGLKFYGKTIKDINKTSFDYFDLLVITPIGYKKELEIYFKDLDKSKIYWIKEIEENNKLIYSFE